MEEAEKIIHAQKDESARNALIEEYSDFIIRCASKACGQYIDKHDDIWSEALIAFNEALTAYDPYKGGFKPFANTVIHNRIIDYLRAGNRQAQVIPFSTLESDDDYGSPPEEELEDEKTSISDVKIEIYSLQNELKAFDISFFELPKASPKSAKTKEACMDVILYIINNEEIYSEIIKTRQLPVKHLLEKLQVNDKILERHRKYIIAGTLIMKGEYTIMNQYFKSGKEVSE